MSNRPHDVLAHSPLPNRPYDALAQTPSLNISQGFVGRPQLCMIDGVKDYIENILFQTCAAQNRRRTEEKSTLGISLNDLNDQLRNSFPEVRIQFPNLTNETIRRIGEPPNKSHNSSNNYHNIIPMKRMRLENNYFKFTEASHDSFAQVNLICEALVLAKGIGDLVTLISMDNSSEEHIGAGCTFTSRYHQLSTMNSTLSPPNCPDHDFYEDKLTPSGYLILTPQPSQLNINSIFPPGYYNTYQDQKQRTRIVVPGDGHLHMFYSSPKLFPLSLETHLSHLRIIMPSTSFLGIMCDKGSDNNFEHDGNFVQYGRFWEENKLDGISYLIPILYLYSLIF
jgi:hypothetical protein